MCFIHVISQFQEWNPIVHIEKFPSLVQNLLWNFRSTLSSGLLLEVKTKKKFQTFSYTKSGRDELQELSNMVIRLKNFVILENCSLRRGTPLREVVAAGGLKALNMTFQHISDHFVSCNCEKVAWAVHASRKWHPRKNWVLCLKIT